MSKKSIISIFIIVVAIAAVVINFTVNKKDEANESKSVEVTKSESTQNAEGKDADVQYAAPDFELTTLNGEKVILSDYQGKKVILNFWATWCPPCKAEMPHMQKFYEKYKDQGVEILAVNLTSQDKGVDKVKAFVEENGLTFPILLDEEGVVGQNYQIATIPTSYMIDTEGNIVKKVVGPMDEEMMESLINLAE